MPFPDGSIVKICNTTSEGLNLTPSAGVSLYQSGQAIDGAKIIEGPYSLVTLMKVGDDLWVVDGDGISPSVQGHRYWRARKTNGAGWGEDHTELLVRDTLGDVTVTSGMLSQSGLILWNATNLVDGNTSTQAFHTDSSGVGSYCQIDFGAGNEKGLTEWRFYVVGEVVAIWDIEYSDDGTTWTKAATGLNCSGGAGWKTITW